VLLLFTPLWQAAALSPHNYFEFHWKLVLPPNYDDAQLQQGALRTKSLLKQSLQTLHVQSKVLLPQVPLLSYPRGMIHLLSHSATKYASSRQSTCRAMHSRRLPSASSTGL